MFPISPVYACEECPAANELGLEETIARSDLIIVGQRSDLSSEEYPETIQITAKYILKGSLQENPITVNSFTADCDYGITIFDDQNYVIFLRDDGDRYSPVKQACSVTTLPYDETTISEFMTTYLGEEAQMQTAPPAETKIDLAQFDLAWTLGAASLGVSMLFVAIIAVLRLRKKR